MSSQHADADVRMTVGLPDGLKGVEETIAQHLVRSVAAMEAVADAVRASDFERIHVALDEHQNALRALQRDRAALRGAPSAGLTELTQQAIAAGNQTRADVCELVRRRLAEVAAQLVHVRRAGHAASCYGDPPSGACLLALRG